MMKSLMVFYEIFSCKQKSEKKNAACKYWLAILKKDEIYKKRQAACKLNLPGANCKSQL